MNKSQRRRRADEVVAGLGINSEERFDAVVSQASARIITFREQGEIKLKEMRTSVRNPAAESSIERLEQALRLHLNPILGDLPLSEIYNPQLKLVVQSLVAKGQAAATINLNIKQAKGVIASALDPKTGEKLFPAFGMQN